MPPTRRAVIDRRLAEARAIGRRLALARETARLSQAQVAASLGIPQSMVAKLELGNRQLRFSEGLELARLFGVQPTDLLPDDTRTPELAGPRRQTKRSRR